MTDLEKIAKSHKLWVKMVINLGCNPSIAEDIVQEMYLKVHRLIEGGKNVMYNNESANRFYIYLTLKSMYFDYKRAKNRYQFFEILENDEANNMYESSSVYSGVDLEQQEAFTKIYNKILDEINSWDFYNKNLCIAYFTTGLSLDKLVKELGIGRSSLYNSIRNYRDIIKDKFMEDVEDFYNKDYDKI